MEYKQFLSRDLAHHLLYEAIINRQSEDDRNTQKKGKIGPY